MVFLIFDPTQSVVPKKTLATDWLICEPCIKQTAVLNCLMTTVSLFPEHLVVAVPVAVFAAAGGFLVGQYLSRRGCKKGQVNSSISKDSPKVVHSFDMEDIGTKAVYCRCWKSKKVRLLLQGPS